MADRRETAQPFRLGRPGARSPGSEVDRSAASPASTQPRIRAPTGSPASAAIRSISANPSAGSRTDCTTGRSRAKR
jgi:hypothetical protein